uniref:Mid2 domain-containing protein n=1 Tax=Strongyloides venezuelensis TaxID=75913 RepID=A0A0K0G022_STRVS
MPSLPNSNSTEIVISTTSSAIFNATYVYNDGPPFGNDSQKFAFFLCGTIIGIGACLYLAFAAIRDRRIRKENNTTYETRNVLPGYAENDDVGRAKERFKR